MGRTAGSSRADILSAAEIIREPNFLQLHWRTSLSELNTEETLNGVQDVDRVVVYSF